MQSYDIQPLVNYYHRKIKQVNLNFKRYLFNRINWDARIIGIKGARGVGKTTLLLQRILEKYKDIDDTFYITLDHLWFRNHSLEELVEYLYTHGITEIYIDEVHKYKDWSQSLKTFYDEFADLRIVYTGSSMLEIENQAQTSQEGRHHTALTDCLSGNISNTRVPLNMNRCNSRTSFRTTLLQLWTSAGRRRFSRCLTNT